MLKSIFTLALNTIFICVLAQSIHTPAEIFSILEKSEISYEIISLKDEVPVPNRNEILNYNNAYRIIHGDDIVAYRYETSPEFDDILALAEDYFFQKDFQSAREMYSRILSADSTYYQVMTYIGQTYGIEGNFEEAIEWYKKTIKVNYIDYMAHWFLADASKEIGDWKTAIDEITIASILNRNNPRIRSSLEAIYEKNKLKTRDWFFNPQMRLERTDSGSVKIEVDADWIGYALTKAVWQFEPGYAQAMGVEPNGYSILEEQECLAGLSAIFDKKKLKKHIEFRALNKAVEAGKFDEYIVYEVMLLQEPQLAYYLSEDFILSVKDYVINVRGKLK